MSNIIKEKIKTLYFFGDSWSTEIGEYEEITKSIDTFGYPKMVADSLNLNYKNFSVNGASQPDMLHHLVTSDIKKGDDAIFSLTAPSRRFYYDTKGVQQNLHGWEVLHQESINDYNDVFLSAVNCYTLYHWCHDRGINPWFLSTFNISYHVDYHHNLWDSIPDSVWILPRTTCVVTQFDVEWFSKYSDYRNSDWYEWLKTNNHAVKKYIQPCEHHPNITGREFIANLIIKKLNK